VASILLADYTFASWLFKLISILWAILPFVLILFFRPLRGLFRPFRDTSRGHRPRHYAYCPPLLQCKSPREDRYPAQLFLFSVSFADALIQPFRAVSSAIHVPLCWAPADFLHATSQTRRRRKQNVCRYKKRATFAGLLRMLFGLFCLSSNPTAYAMPGTNRVLIRGESSLDTTRQQQQVEHVITNLTSNSTEASPDTAHATPTANTAQQTTSQLRNYPHCFIVDTDSKPMCVDSAANRVIVNDLRLVRNYNVIPNHPVKGIAGEPAKAYGYGIFDIELCSDEGHKNTVPLSQAMYVPTSPYNLIPPQLLYAALKANIFDTRRFHHDDKDYVFQYIAKGEQRSGAHSRCSCNPTVSSCFALILASRRSCRKRRSIIIKAVSAGLERPRVRI